MLPKRIDVRLIPDESGVDTGTVDFTDKYRTY